MRSLMIPLGLLLVFFGLCPPSSRAGVLPSPGRVGRMGLKTLQDRRSSLRDKAETVLSGENDGAKEGKELAEYMINELKRKAPHNGNEILDLKSMVPKTRNTRYSFDLFCNFYPQYCSCAADEFECSSGICIPGFWECDRWDDCGDSSDDSISSDEVNCVCGSDEFTCDSGHCIPDYWQCDIIADCLDGSDERGCVFNPSTEIPSSAMPTTQATTSMTSPACGWGGWGEWSECNTGCGAGQRTRTRACQCADVSRCVGQNTEYGMCQLATCMPEADSGCGSRHPQGSAQRIVGGNAAVRGAWPWYAQLLFNGGFTCGGTLVQDKFIVTAAHCIDRSGGMTPQNWNVILGKHKENDSERREHRSEVSAVIVHANYDSGTVDSDIAILVLTSPPSLPQDPSNEVISSVCLDTAADEADDSLVCFIAGFGYTQEEGSVSTVLQEAEVPIVSRSECNKPESYSGDITENMLCAGFVTGGVDACQGDSGGPLMCSRRSRDEVTGAETERWYLTGITSWGNGCARQNLPGVYTNVAKYGQWIENVMAAHGGSGSP